jgi:leucine dehydrogenase
MSVFEQFEQHEQVIHFSDAVSGLRAIIAIHSTALGRALGGTRFYPYASEDAALQDVLRLSRGMTYKAAAAGLDLGGGKAVILGDPRRLKSEELLRAYGRFIESLGGRYITAEDVGTSRADMDMIRRETRFVTGVSPSLGGSDDPSPSTAYGVYLSMLACAEEVWQQHSLRERRIAVQGVGKVGYYLVKHAIEDGGAQVVAADVDVDAVARVVRDFGVQTVPPEQIHTVDCDIFAPCALGGVLNADTIPQLRCRAVAGSANNQLQRAEDGKALAELGILYAPDFITNAGGLINVADELSGYAPERARASIANVYRTLREVFTIARGDNVSTAEAADHYAETRLERISRLRRYWVPTTRPQA